jgi:hypothetical protein
MMYSSSFPQTVHFLERLSQNNANLDSPEHLMYLLISNLSVDGYELHSAGDVISDRSRNLQSESVDTSSPDFATNIVLIGVCVLFAGFASGLTQVSQSNLRQLRSRFIYVYMYIFVSGSFISGLYGNENQISKWYTERKGICE